MRIFCKAFIHEETGDFVRVVFVRPQATVSDRKHEEEYKIVLDFVKEHGKVTKKEVITLLNCKDTKTKMILKEMTETELTKITKGIYTYYILKTNGVK